MPSPSKNLRIFEILARQNESMLSAYIRGIVRDNALADDIAQATWIIAWKKLPELKDPAAFPSWLRSIARFEAMNTLRKTKREAFIEFTQMEDASEAFSRWEINSRTGNIEETLRTLETCYDLLPNSLRSVCREHYFQNRKAREIAETHSLALPTVLKRLQRCREALRECLNSKLPGQSHA